MIALLFSKRSLLSFLWALSIGGVVAWVGCGSDTSAGGTDSTGNTSPSDTSSSSGTPEPCLGGLNCPPSLPSPGSPCDTPGLCCSFIICDHAGGVNTSNATCGDAGAWEW